MKSKILIFGGSGLVGSRFIQLNKDYFETSAPEAIQVDILMQDQIRNIVQKMDPQTVINFAAFTDVQGAEKQKDDKEAICYRLNAIGTKNVAEVCKEYGKHLVHISTDYVFDGQKQTGPYTEGDNPNPVNWYGKTKYFGEQFVLESGCKSTIVRISMPFSSHFEPKLDVARFFLEQLRTNNQVNAIVDQYITPTFVEDIAKALAILVTRKAKGYYHISSTNDTTPFKFATMIAQAFNLNTSLIRQISLEEYNKDKLAPLLKFSRLDPSKFVREFGSGILHTVEEGVKLFEEKVDADSYN